MNLTKLRLKSPYKYMSKLNRIQQRPTAFKHSLKFITRGHYYLSQFTKCIITLGF